MTTIKNMALSRLLCAQKRERRSRLQQTVATFQISPPSSITSQGESLEEGVRVSFL